MKPQGLCVFFLILFLICDVTPRNLSPSLSLNCFTYKIVLWKHVALYPGSVFQHSIICSVLWLICSSIQQIYFEYLSCLRHWNSCIGTIKKVRHYLELKKNRRWSSYMYKNNYIINDYILSVIQWCRWYTKKGFASQRLG